jgi:transposase
VPKAIVPDNLRSAVSRAHRYEPELNPAYAEFAEHYGVTILPARVRRPRDKAKVEGAVLIVERWILACLRNRQFFSLGELNAGIRELLTALNTRPFKKLAGSRQSRFIELDRPVLTPLPSRAYEFATWKSAKVHPDYHVQVEHAYYSVPHTLIAQQVDVRITAHMLEIFKDRQLIATHPRVTRRGQRRTTEAHRPVNHRAVIDNTMQRLLDRAAVIGPSTAAVLTEQFNRKAHPEEALRSAQGILRLEKDFSAAALEAACIKALALKSYSYRLLRNLLTTSSSHGESEQTRQLSLVHDNVRGSDYFH